MLLFYAQPHAEEAAAGRRMGRAAGREDAFPTRFTVQPHAGEAAAGRRMGRAAGVGRMEWIMDV